jgi:hypothetical protein
LGKKSKPGDKPAEQPDTAADKPAAHLTKLQELVTRARQGDDAVVPQMREVLKHSELWREIGDMARHAQDTWLKLIAGDDHLVKESIRKSLTELRNELEEPGASRLEKLLIERIVATWLQVQFAEINVATSEKQPIPQRRFYQQQLDSANRQFLTSTKQLLALRHLLPKLDKRKCPEAFYPLPEKSNGNGHMNGHKLDKRNGQPVNRLLALAGKDDD